MTWYIWKCGRFAYVGNANPLNETRYFADGNQLWVRIGMGLYFMRRSLPQ